MPTYNEAQSLASTVEGLISEVDTVDILIVDDNSQDGTALKNRGWVPLTLMAFDMHSQMIITLLLRWTQMAPTKPMIFREFWRQ
jgi:hypothetical protein